MQGQCELDRRGARLDERLPIGSNAYDEVCKEMNRMHGSASAAADKITNDKKDSKQESCGPKSDVCVNPDPSKKLPDIDWKKVEPMPNPKVPRDMPMPEPRQPKGEPMPKPMPREPRDPRDNPKPEPGFPKGEPTPKPMPPEAQPIPMPEPKFPKGEPMPKSTVPKHGDSGPKLPAEQDEKNKPGGGGHGVEAMQKERPVTDCGFGGSRHGDNSSDLSTRRSNGGAERQSPSDSGSRTGHKANVMNQFPTVELFAN